MADRWRNNPFNTRPLTTRNHEYRETTYDREIDAFVVRSLETEAPYRVDIEAASKRTVPRFSAEIDHPSINWAADFEVGDEIPA